MKFTRATFTKGERVNITFDLNYEGAPQMPPIIGVKGFDIGDLPYPTGTQQGKLFNGWVYSATGVAVKTTDKINGPIALKATWADLVKGSQIDVSFTGNITAVGSGATATAIDAGAGYKFTYGSSGYSGSWAKFKITLDTGVSLASYKEVTFKYKSEGGDTAYKPFALLAAASLGTSLPNDPHNEGTGIRINAVNVEGNTTEDWVEAAFTIDKSKTYNLKNAIELCIYDHSAADNNGEKTAWSIKDVSFIPEE